jgi:hypothetical protein
LVGAENIISGLYKKYPTGNNTQSIHRAIESRAFVKVSWLFKLISDLNSYIIIIV